MDILVAHCHTGEHRNEAPPLSILTGARLSQRLQ
jgi:hypothetical protein